MLLRAVWRVSGVSVAVAGLAKVLREFHLVAATKLIGRHDAKESVVEALFVLPGEKQLCRRFSIPA